MAMHNPSRPLTPLALLLALLLHNGAHPLRQRRQPRLQLCPQCSLRLGGRPLGGMQLVSPLPLQVMLILWGVWGVRMGSGGSSQREPTWG